MRLSTKVLLALAIVIAVALVTASLMIGRSTSNAYRVYLRGYQQQQLLQLADEAGRRYAETGSWDEVQTWLTSAADDPATPGSMGNGRGQGRGQQRRQQQPAMNSAVVVVDTESGRPLAASVPPDAVDGFLVGAPITVDGKTIAALATEPTLIKMGDAEETLFNQVNRAVLLSALVAGLVAAVGRLAAGCQHAAPATQTGGGRRGSGGRRSGSTCRG